MFAVAQRHRIKTAFRRLAARQRIEAVFTQHLGDRAQPVGRSGCPAASDGRDMRNASVTASCIILSLQGRPI